MATIIKSVSFQNFYNYYGDFEDNIYHFKEGINIVNADNNMGKSKFYNGFLWILKGKVYDSDLKRMVDASSSFQKMASGKALSEKSKFNVGVNITFAENNDKYTVSKIIQFEKNGEDWNTNEKLDIMQTINNSDIPVNDIAEKDKIVKKIIPGELMNYALLQGESMEKLVDLSSRDGLSSTIEALAGMNNLIEICDISKALSKLSINLCTKKETETSTNRAESEKLVAEKEAFENRVETTKAQIETYKTELSEATKKKDTLEAILLNAKNRVKFREAQKALLTEINRLKEQKNVCEKNITTLLFSEISPWILMGLGDEINNFTGNYTCFIKELADQQAWSRLQKDPTILLLPPNSPDKSSLRRMLDTEVCEICGRNAFKNSEHWKHIEKVLMRPKDTVSSNKNDFSSFYGGVQTTISSFFNSIPTVSQSIQDYRDKIDVLDDLIIRKEEDKENVKLELLNAGGSENNIETTTDKQNIADYTLADNTIRKKEEDIRRAEDTIRGWEVKINQIDDSLKKINTNSEIEGFRKFKETMANIEYIFLNTKERIFDEILKSLEVNANRKYGELTQGNLSAGGKLSFSKQADRTVQVSIKNINDGELTGLGTGFQRMKQLSIIMAIISSKVGNKQFNYPFISDAPFSEFGDNFINNFFKIAPNVFTQSIILIKELYDPYANNYLNDLGNKILKKMEDGEIIGTFYINTIEEKADTTNLVTKNKCYKE